jgi:predicted nucleotidyltransferase
VEPMSEELEVLKEVARRLNEAGIAYMITGSTATNFYAVPRMTRDIDIVVELSKHDVEKFILAFEKDYYLDPDTLRQAVKHKKMFNVIHERHVMKVDFVVRKDTAYRKKEFSRKKKVVVDGQVAYVVAPEDLILSKLEWAKDSKSEVQLRDIRNLLECVKGMDRRYLARWAKHLGVTSLYREVTR